MAFPADSQTVMLELFTLVALTYWHEDTQVEELLWMNLGELQAEQRRARGEPRPEDWRQYGSAQVALH